MKKAYNIFILKSKEIHVPSGDYYSKNNEASTDDINVLIFVDSYDTEKEAEDSLLETFKKYPHDDKHYIILPKYTQI